MESSTKVRGTEIRGQGTEKRKYGQEPVLKNSEAYYRAIVDASNDAILVHDPQTGAILDNNARFTEMFGYEQKQLNKICLKDLCSTSPYTEDNIIQKIRLASQYGAQIFEWQSKTKYGKFIWVEINLKRAQLTDKVCILAFIQDISDRKLTDQSLRESEKKWRSLAENVPDFITMLDSSGTITFVNRTDSETRGNIIGSSIFDHYPDSQNDKIRKAINKAHNGIMSSIETEQINTAGNPSHYVVRFAPVKEDEQVIGVVLIGTDITEQKAAQTQLMSSQSDLEQKNRSLATIIKIADRVNRILDTDSVAKEAVESVSDYKSSSSIAFFLIDNDNKSMELIYGLGWGESDYQKGYQLPLQGSISEITAQHGTVTNIVNFSEEERLSPHIKESLTAHGFQSCYSIPLLFQTEVIGAMTLLFHNNQKITEAENQTLLHIGKTVGLALANARYVDRIQLEIKERQYAEETLRNVAVGISSATGDAFFRGIVADFVNTFGVAYAFIGKLVDPSRVQIIAAHGETVMSNFEYSLMGTPCENVIQGNLCTYCDSVQSRFPEDSLLIELGVDGYIGTPLFDSSGAIIGLLVIMDTKPLKHVDLLVSVLSIVANRSSSEMERLNAEQALRLSEEHLRLALKASNVGTWEWNIKPNRMIWSENSCDLFHIDSMSALSTFEEYLQHIHNDDLADIKAAFEQSLNSGAAISIQHRLKTKKAGLRWLAGQGEIFFNQDGTPSYMRGTISDVTERQQFQVKLLESKNMLQLVLDTIPTRVYWKDRDSVYQGCNKKFAQDTGLSTADQIIGKTDFDLIRKDLADKYRQDDLSIIKSNRSKLNLEDSTINANGETIWLESNKIPLTDIEGNTIGVLGTYSDISARKKAIEEKKLSQQKLELHFQQTPLAVIEWDMNFKVRDWNPAAERIFGYSKAEAVGHLATELIVDSAAFPAVNEVWSTLLSNKGGKRSTNSNTTKSGKPITCEWYNTPLVATNGHVIGVTSIAQDITSRISNEHELKVYREHLEELVAKRTDDLIRVNKELEAFSYSVSHDLRSPLRSIDGFSQALLEDYGTSFDRTAKDYLSRVRNAAQRMSTLIDDLLQLSRLSRSELKRENVNLSKLANEIAEKFKNDGSQRSARIFINPDMKVQGDEGLLRVVLDNLLNNAWKYTSHNSFTEIEFDCTKVNNETVFYIRDNGAGFNMEYVDKLFSAFQRLHASEEFEGNGIGLATVSRIIHRHGGKSWAEGVVNQGATFYFTVPQSLTINRP